MPGWMADRLGIATGGADGATWQLDYAWHLPPWATLLLIVATISFIAMLYARESSGAGPAYRVLLAVLRLAALALVLMMLAQWALALRLTGPAALVLVVDHSASMHTADRYAASELPAAVQEGLAAGDYGEPTRLNLAKSLLTSGEGSWLQQLRRRYRVEAYAVAGGVERLSHGDGVAGLADSLRALSADGPAAESTRLGDGVRQVLRDFRGAPPAAIVFFTDGVTTAGIPLAEAAQEAARQGVPLFTVGLGSAEPPRDIELADVLVDDVVFVDDPVRFQVQIKASGLEGERATLRLRRDGDDTPLAERPIALPAPGETLTETIVHRPAKAGEFTYAVEIAPREDETNGQNNRQTRAVDVRDVKIRVLLAYGYPNFEFRFLKTLLERDSTIELATYLQDADPDYAQQDKTALVNFPMSREELFEYDVLLVGDTDPRLLPRSVWQHVHSFVTEKAGGVAFLAGPRYFPSLYGNNSQVRALAPIEMGAIVAGPDVLDGDVSHGFAVEPTRLGLANPALQLGDTREETERIWQRLEPLYWLYPVADLKPAAQVLAVARSAAAASPAGATANPVVCFQYVGPGRVWFHAIDSTWRWRIGGGDAYFARYWVQTVRFLARGKLGGGGGVELTTDRRQYARGEAVELRARFFDPRLAPPGDEATATVEAPGERRRQVRLHRNPAVASVFEASVDGLPPAAYEVLLTDPQSPDKPPAARFTVAAPPGELAGVEMDASALESAAHTTHGKFYTVANAEHLLQELPAGRRVPIENLPPISIWNRWWMLAAFVAVLTSEWLLRKRRGML